MSDDRPNPDDLLARVQADEARAARGKLKIFFGAAPGVGKTYAMLEAARKAAKAGVDVVVGYIEPHVRPETQALVLGLDMLPRREIEYRGKQLHEFDLEAALRRRPRIVLVDELAHTNTSAPSARMVVHSKRWRDVDQLLAAGIDVYTTLNVQHLDSLNDVVARITGVVVRETVPDVLFESADEVEFVDLAPDDLIERLREGKVYLPEQAERAIERFFNKGNLIALRELALRRMAERVESQMAAYRAEHAIERTWPAAERLLVCVGPGPTSANLVRAARRMAANLRAPWLAVHVETPAESRLSADDRQRLSQTMHLAERLGAEAVTIAGADVPGELVALARDRNVSKIIVGKPTQSRLRDWLRGSFVYELMRRCGEIDVYLISGDAEAPAHAPRGDRPRAPWTGYAWAVAAVALCTAAGFLLVGRIDPVNLVMLYLLAVVVVSLRHGRGPSALASVLGVAAFDFFFIPPYGTFAVSDTQYLFTFAVLLVTGILISTLTARAAVQARAARQRAQRVAGLYAVARDLVHAGSRAAVGECAVKHLRGLRENDVFLWAAVSGDDGRPRLSLISAVADLPDDREQAVARWVFDHAQPAGPGTETLSAAEILCVPLLAASGCVGVLGLRLAARREARAAVYPRSLPFSGDEFRLLETFAGQLALALERIRTMEDAGRDRLQLETERLRNALLSAVSHDLRTPLAAITGAASALVDDSDGLSPAARDELARSIGDEARRLNRLVTNLLDMTRLESGAITPRREWHDLPELIGGVVGRLPIESRRRVETRIPGDAPLAFVDGLLIQQVLANLLENALRHATNGPIEISAEFDGPRLLIEVADRGPGIAPGDEERIFEKFYRPADGPVHSGAGLGLTICRGFVELHQGTIVADNRPGGGARFRVALPQPDTPPAAPPEAPL
jgi:two-component system sensor histidine kinase KdpD